VKKKKLPRNVEKTLSRRKRTPKTSGSERYGRRRNGKNGRKGRKK
jgi:hypothetical protein